MRNSTAEQKPSNFSFAAILSFLGSLVFCSFFSSVIIVSETNVERLQMERLIFEKTLRINAVLSKLLYKTNSLSAIVIQGGGAVNNFEKTAPIIATDDPAIFNVLLAPDGIVSHVYPPENNEAVIGLNFFGPGAGNREAVAARDAGALVLAGPFMSAQGVEILTGRMPVYIDTPGEDNKFWGLVSVTLRFPEALTDVELEILRNRNFSYELWRTNPDTNEKQVIAGNYDHPVSKNNFIEKDISVFNADWYLKVWPIRRWYTHPKNLIFIMSGLIISFLVLFVMQNNFELKQMKLVLEEMASSDPLTDIYNRRHFMEITRINVERERRLKGNCYIVLFDLDKFKNINDTYGHATGDNVLIDTAARIKANIRPYDLFARYGGEEFILFASNTDRDGIIDMVERLRLSISNEKFEYDNISIAVSASFGIAHIGDYDIEKAIVNADKALYAAKKNGRNRTEFI